MTGGLPRRKDWGCSPILPGTECGYPAVITTPEDRDDPHFRPGPAAHPRELHAAVAAFLPRARRRGSSATHGGRPWRAAPHLEADLRALPPAGQRTAAGGP